MDLQQTHPKRLLQYNSFQQEQSLILSPNDRGQVIIETLILLTFLVGFFSMIHFRFKEQEKNLNLYHFSKGRHEAKNF